jgi:tRNA nucleotidyltransferase/poly(A) polymerase
MLSFIVNNQQEELNRLRMIFLGHGHDIRFVGGCVRDGLSYKDSKDTDMCTDATPEQQIEIYKGYGYKYVATGLKHGTITVMIPVKDNEGKFESYEITSLRIDVETDGRHAVVEYSRDWELDLARRDFTMNAMSLTFDGRLIDPFDGYNDLENDIIRFVGDPEQRIKEDYLRILRWFRFYGRFSDMHSFNLGASNEFVLLHNGDAEDNKIIDLQNSAFAASQRAIKNNLSGLKSISRERIWDELKKMIGQVYINRLPLLWDLMIKMGVFDHVADDPIVFDNSNLENLKYFSGNRHYITNYVKNEYKAGILVAVVMAIMARDETQISYLAKNWKWSNKEAQDAKFLHKHLTSNVESAELYLIHGCSLPMVETLNEFRRIFRPNTNLGINADPTKDQFMSNPSVTTLKCPVTGSDFMDLPDPTKIGTALDTIKMKWYELLKQKTVHMTKYNVSVDFTVDLRPQLMVEVEKLKEQYKAQVA